MRPIEELSRQLLAFARLLAYDPQDREHETSREPLERTMEARA